MIEEKNDVKIVNPENGEIINCTHIISTLKSIYHNDKKNKDYINISKYLNILLQCAKWDDTLEKDINKLENLFKREEFSQNTISLIKKIIVRLSVNEEKKCISERFKEYYKIKKEVKGIPFLVEELDILTGGIIPGTLCTIAGGPGSMKTTYAMNISYNALCEGYNVCYISLEETPETLFGKLLSRISIDQNYNIPVSNILRHNLSENQENILFNEIYNKYNSLPGHLEIVGDSDLGNMDEDCFESVFEQIDKKFIKDTGNGIDLIVIDHIQLLKYASINADEYRLINSYISFFRKQSQSFLGKNRQVAFILLSQVNREGINYAAKSKSSEEGQYCMHHVAEASELERASSYIITTYVSQMLQLSKNAKIGVLKLRNSKLPSSLITINADGEYYSFGEQCYKSKQLLVNKNYSIQEIINNDFKGEHQNSLSNEKLMNDMFLNM